MHINDDKNAWISAFVSLKVFEKKSFMADVVIYQHKRLQQLRSLRISLDMPSRMLKVPALKSFSPTRLLHAAESS